MAVLEKKF